MNNLLTKKDPTILVVGLHERIIQSILDFDYVKGTSKPSVVGVIGGGKQSHKFWFGDTEVLLPVYRDMQSVVAKPDWLLNLASANSAKRVTDNFFSQFKNAFGAHIFCEGLSEQDALSIINTHNSKVIAGPSGVGLLVPGHLKLGAIGGILGGNINHVAKKRGDTAVICSSGGMVNELVDSVLRAGGVPSFAVSFGGDRFPVTSPLEWFLLAEKDEATRQIVYFGELGGDDEYVIAEAIEKGVITKPVSAYIAGRYDTAGKRVQFGHAKALAGDGKTDAVSKTARLQSAGVTASSSYRDFIMRINNCKFMTKEMEDSRDFDLPETARKQSLFTAKKDESEHADDFVPHILSVLLEKKSVSSELSNFANKSFSLLIDHGVQPSGTVNTMITARAGRDMSSALASAVLTVGDRFGGAINQSAKTWFDAVNNNTGVEDLLEDHKQAGRPVMGIGHKKYSVENPDTRVTELINEAKSVLKEAKYLTYALAVEERTIQKKSSLILNVDGALAAILLDLLSEYEEMSHEEIEELFTIEFFNSFFLIPRTVGFISTFLGQKRRDEGLFRLPDDQVHYL
tara:strand:- start:39 stop:1751 length:1713 start_codon:yes stop_codon:yes gene_type:complete